MSTATADEPMHADPSQVLDAQAGDVRANDAQADHAEANDAQADHAQANDPQADHARVDHAQASHAQASHAEAHDAQADYAQASHAQAEDAQADHAADAMKDQLRKDVASWREGRSEGSGRGATELSVAVARSIVPPTNARMKRAKPVVSEVKPASTEKKPFGMSYDGTSRSDYIKLMIARGAR
jgi:hypothetical protein